LRRKAQNFLERHVSPEIFKKWNLEFGLKIVDFNNNNLYSRMAILRKKKDNTFSVQLRVGK